ncbi:MAG TPA: TetR family transcriptional regulator [Actinomycetota bacterium]|nr:TetR family transcriptional regulator [Actinomycetota bacterium]
MSARMAAGRTGRRVGESRTREAILDAARARFADRGYDGATIRGIASDAGVDPALVHHYFGTKERLFAAVMQLPVAPGEIAAELLLGPDLDDIGDRLVRTLFRFWESREFQEAVVGLIRSAVSNEQAARMLREFVHDAIITRIAERLGTPDAELRASLVASQVIGLAIARYIVRVEPIASASVDDLVPAIAPTLQRYLTGDIGSA